MSGAQFRTLALVVAAASCSTATSMPAEERPGLTEMRKQGYPNGLATIGIGATISVTSPEPTYREMPLYPTSAGEVRGEGMCLAVYDILNDGSTDRIRACCHVKRILSSERVTNLELRREFQDSIKEAVKHWRFNPTFDDAPAQQVDVATEIMFAAVFHAPRFDAPSLDACLIGDGFHR